MNAVPDQNHAEVLKRVMAQYGTALKRMCTVYLRDAAMAEDAVQDTFLKAFKKMDTFPAPEFEQAWLMRIAINTCKDYLRSNWFRRIDYGRGIDTAASPETVSIPDQSVLDAVMRLPLKYREAILLRYYQNMKPAEISRTLNIPVNTVKMRIKRGNAKLRQKLEGWYENE